jgi:GMP reductase
MRIINDIKLDFDDVLICPKRSETGSRADVNLVRKFVTRNSKQVIEGVPIMAANMDATGTLMMCEELHKEKMFTCLHKFYQPELLLEFFHNNESSDNAFYTLGITNDDFDKLKYVSDRVTIDKICVDVANGYTKFFVDKLKKIRELHPKAIIMAGNVATPDMTQELILAGADIIKIGIGPGRVCETRKVTGVGYYQLSAIIECADIAHGLNGHICADGGCSTSGDICKAFGAGADFVMLGSMLAGHDECEGEWIYEKVFNGPEKRLDDFMVARSMARKKALKFYGMSSKDAMEKYYGGVAEHRAPEGRSTEMPYKGKVKETLKNIMGGIRSACAYIGTNDIKHFSKCTTFVKSK